MDKQIFSTLQLILLKMFNTPLNSSVGYILKCCNFYNTFIAIDMHIITINLKLYFEHAEHKRALDLPLFTLLLPFSALRVDAFFSAY